MIRALLAVDVGGTRARVRAEAVADATAEVVAECEHDLQWGRPDDAQRELRVVLELAERALGEVRGGDPHALAVAFPGTLDGLGVIQRWPNRSGWTGLPLADLVTDRLGIRPVIRDDAVMAAHAEALVPPRQRAASLFYLGVGTGVGGAYVPADGAGRLDDIIACEPGHLIIWPDAVETCECGRAGCLQAYASGRAVRRLAAMLGPRGAQEQAVRALAIALANVAELYAPQRVVIGGGFATARPQLIPQVAEAVADRARAGTPVPVLETAAHGARSSLMGAVLAARAMLPTDAKCQEHTGPRERILT